MRQMCWRWKPETDTDTAEARRTWSDGVSGSPGGGRHVRDGIDGRKWAFRSFTAGSNDGACGTGGWIYDTQVAEMRKRERESEEGRKEGEEAVTPSQALGGDLRHCFPSFPVKMSTLSTFYA